MGFSINAALVLFLVASNVASSMATTYNVGDASGWTITGDVNYTEWASSKTFTAGDIVRFIYNPQLHSLVQVVFSDYLSCNATRPIAEYRTGNESIQIMGDHDHYYFISSIPGNCDMGLKVDIQVVVVSTGLPDQGPDTSPPHTPPSPPKSTPPPHTPPSDPPPESYTPPDDTPSPPTSAMVYIGLVITVIISASDVIFMLGWFIMERLNLLET